MDAIHTLTRLRNLTNKNVARSTRRRRRRRPKVLIEDRGGIAAIVPLAGCRWEAADLTRVRDRATSLIAGGTRRVGVDLAGAETLPSGFFAQLCHWNDCGAEVVLFSPGPAIRRMIWFRAFMSRCGDRSSTWRFVARSTPAWKTFASNSDGGNPL